jgi:C4-dicarboxylate-specific signal transduction histidine kinase
MNDNDLVPVGHGLAGFSHDLKNVLAILSESVGLIGDLIEAGSASASDRAFGRIERQLERADGLAAGLSRFAHTFDDPDAPQPLSHLVDQALFLVDRRARSRPVELSVALDVEPEVSAPVAFLLRLALLLESAVDSAPSGSRLRVACDGDRVLLTDEGGAPVGDVPLR